MEQNNYEVISGGDNRCEFYFYSDKGGITGIRDFQVCKYIKQQWELTVVSGSFYIYGDGYFRLDATGAQMKTIISDLLVEDWRRSTIINRIYNLLISDFELEKSMDDMNSYPEHFVPFKNGFFDPTTNSIVPHNPKFRNTYCIQHSYYPERAPNEYRRESTDRFIAAALPDIDNRKCLFQCFGLAYNRETKIRMILILLGAGQTGKSTLLNNETFALGAKNVSNVALADLTRRFGTFSLVNKTANICSDIDSRLIEDTGIIKQLTGSDYITAEQKGKDSFSFKNFASLIFSANQMPKVDAEKSAAFYSRLKIIPMNQKPDRLNPRLEEELKAEVDYFIYLCMQGLRQIYTEQNGEIYESPDCKRLVRIARQDSDTCQAWIDHAGIEHGDENMSRSELFEEYKRYCEESDRTAQSKNGFYRTMRAKNFSEVVVHGQHCFKVSRNKSDSDDFVALRDDDLVPFH